MGKTLQLLRHGLAGILVAGISTTAIAESPGGYPPTMPAPGPLADPLARPQGSAMGGPGGAMGGPMGAMGGAMGGMRIPAGPMGGPGGPMGGPMGGPGGPMGGPGGPMGGPGGPMGGPGGPMGPGGEPMGPGGGVMPVSMAVSPDGVPYAQSGYAGGGDDPYGILPGPYGGGYAAGGACDGSCDSGGGLLGRLSLHGCHRCGTAGLLRSRPMCLFCLNEGCGLCENLAPGRLLGLLQALGPYTEGGRCAQRWYDVQAEALFLSRESSGAGRPLANQNIAAGAPGTPPDNVVLSTDVGDGSDAGLRVSIAKICGVGGNIEATYMGLHEFGGASTALGSGGGTVGDLYSVFSDFGRAPFNGFADTDRSVFQSAEIDSKFHSGEVNYRRRWVGPYCRFQGSWLAGLRYLDVDEEFTYRTLGEDAGADTPFFSSVTKVRNAMTGPQLGGDLWWNVYPGINLGVSLKGGLLGNVAEQRATLDAESLAGATLTEGAEDSRTAYMQEFMLMAVYRFSYSWSLRASYYYLDVENVALADANFSAELGSTGNFAQRLAARQERIDNSSTLTLDGFSIGAEYIW